MSVHSPPEPRRADRVRQLIQVMTAAGVEVMEATIDPCAPPRDLSSGHADVFGMVVGAPGRFAVGAVVDSDDLEDLRGRANVRHLATWATAYGARMFLGVIPKVGAGEREVAAVDRARRDGWQVVEIE